MQTYSTSSATDRTLATPSTPTQPQTIYTAKDLPPRDPAQMLIADLIQAYRVENERCCCGQPQDQRHAYELFRRALVERDELAWQHICAEYAELVELWVQRCGGVGGVARRAWLVAAAFARFRQAVTCFETFPTLTSLLHHLQFCAAYVVVDAARSTAQTPAVIVEQGEVELARAVGDK